MIWMHCMGKKTFDCQKKFLIPSYFPRKSISSKSLQLSICLHMEQFLHLVYRLAIKSWNHQLNWTGLSLAVHESGIFLHTVLFATELLQKRACRAQFATTCCCIKIRCQIQFCMQVEKWMSYKYLGAPFNHHDDDSLSLLWVEVVMIIVAKKIAETTVVMFNEQIV